MAAAFQDTAQFTWGLQATRVTPRVYPAKAFAWPSSTLGWTCSIRTSVAAALPHRASFHSKTVQDGQGHGTHASGPRAVRERPPSGVRRYGCAFGAYVFAGKVLSNSGKQRWQLGAERHELGSHQPLPGDLDVARGRTSIRSRRHSKRRGSALCRPGCLIIAAASSTTRIGPEATSGSRASPLTARRSWRLPPWIATCASRISLPVAAR